MHGDSCINYTVTNVHLLMEEHEGIPRSYVRRDSTLIWGNISSLIVSSTFGTLLTTEQLHLLLWTASRTDSKDCWIPGVWVCYGHLWPKTPEAKPASFWGSLVGELLQNLAIIQLLELVIINTELNSPPPMLLLMLWRSVRGQWVSSGLPHHTFTTVRSIVCRWPTIRPYPWMLVASVWNFVLYHNIWIWNTTIYWLALWATI